MRNMLQKTPLETGNRWAIYALIALACFVVGWIAHSLSSPLVCGWAV